MEAIDFKKLLREERRRAKQKTKAAKEPSEKKTEKEDSADRSDKNAKADAQYSWRHPDGFLDFRELALSCICEDPRSISYSSTALGKQTPKVENANGGEPLPSGSNITEPKFPPGITVDKTLMSPEDALQNWLQNLPSGDSGLGEWKVMNFGKRRVCMFGEETGGSLPPPLAEIARELVRRNVFPASLGPNHVLLNEYQPGQGILPHTDGPRYEHRTATLSLGSDVVIEFTKRLTSSEIGSIKQAATHTESTKSNHGVDSDNTDNVPRSGNGDQPSSLSPIQILLEAGSLLVFDDDAYLNYCHGIEMDVWRDVARDCCLNATSGKIVPRGLRYSLTFRHKKSEQTKQLKK